MRERLLALGCVLLGALALDACGVAATHSIGPPPANVPRSGTVATTTADGSIVLLGGGAVFAVLSGDASSWTGDRVTLVANGDVMLNSARRDRAEVSFVGDAGTARAYSNTGEHTQESGATDGSLVLLDDGSVWVVARADRGHNVEWSEGSVVDVEPGSHGLYRLSNPSSGSSVAAAYVGEK